MFDLKKSKRQAKLNLKRHYVIFVATCLLASFIGANYNSSTEILKNENTSLGIISDENKSTVLYDLLFTDLNTSENDVKGIEVKDSKIGPLELGHSNGILALCASSFTTGSFLIVIYKAIKTSLRLNDFFAKVAVILAAFLLSLIAIFVRNAYQIIYRRIFLEGYKYNEIKTSRFVFIFRCKKFLNATWCSLKTEILTYLWGLTIVGGIIKSFSYAMVPYIVAENPSIKASQAIKLSKKMMYGHKFEFFKYQLSFIGWYLLDSFTFGLSGIIFSNPYLEAFNVEYYLYLRGLAIDNKLEGYEYLNDKYLFEFAPKDLLKKTYEELYKNNNNHIEFPTYGKLENFLARNMGIVYTYDEKSNQYSKALLAKAHHDLYNDIFNYQSYPEKLSPLNINENVYKDTTVLANRQYSLSFLLLIFFIISFIGWLWEVTLNLVNNGTLVNRGVFHGPWLPIYGFGVLLILTCLYRFRKSLLQEFTSAIILCGLVEYFSSVYLELTNNGLRWWDYTGYYLNINGRICAEGLLVFGIGGCVCVYFLVPMIDNFLRKLKPSIIKMLCILLSICFLLDLGYSINHKNTGIGITSDISNIESESVC